MKQDVKLLLLFHRVFFLDFSALAAKIVFFLFKFSQILNTFSKYKYRDHCKTS